MIVTPYRLVVVPVVRRRIGHIFVLALAVALYVAVAMAGGHALGGHTGHLAHGSSVAMSVDVSSASSAAPAHPHRTPASCHGHDDCLGRPLWIHAKNAPGVSTGVATGHPSRFPDRTALPTSATRHTPSLAALGVLRV